MSIDRPTVLYDADCGFCRWSLAQLLRLDPHERLRLVSLQSPEAAELLPHLTPAERDAAAHLVDGDGRVVSGGDAVVPLARVLGAGTPSVALLRALRPVVTPGYRVVAANRRRLSKLVPAGAKRRADQAITARLGVAAPEDR